MSGIVVDSSVVAKWVLPETDSAQAHAVLAEAIAGGGRPIVLDLVFPEVANAIWKRYRQKQITLAEARAFLQALLSLPVHVEPAAPHLPAAIEIAMKYDRAVYDALFVALAQEIGGGVAADEPLFNAVRADIPEVQLLRNL